MGKKANQDDRFGVIGGAGSSSGQVALLLFVAVTSGMATAGREAGN